MDPDKQHNIPTVIFFLKIFTRIYSDIQIYVSSSYLRELLKTAPGSKQYALIVQAVYNLTTLTS